MQIKVDLFSIPFLPLDYSHVMDFESLSSQITWFNERVRKSVYANIKYDNQRPYILLDMPYQDVRSHYDYIRYNDGLPNSTSYMVYYYFITDYEFVTSSTTRIYLKLDVWTTYYFNHSLMTFYEMGLESVSFYETDISIFSINF